MTSKTLRSSFLAGSTVALSILLMVTKAPLSVWLLCAALVLCVATMLASSAAREVLLTLTSVVFALCIVEYVGVLTEPKVVLDIEQGLAAPRLAVGWGPQREGVYRARELLNGRLVYDVRYTIDDRRFRKVHAGGTGPAVAFLGDSFIFGVGVDDADTLPQRFADIEGRKLPVYDLGIGAYSPAQVLASMQLGLDDDLLGRSELLVQFLAPWHAERSSCRRSWTVEAPRYERAGDGVRFAGVCRTPPLNSLKTSAFYRSFIEPRIGLVTDDDIALLVAITKETVKLAREKYHKPMIIYYKREQAFLKRLHWTDDEIIAALSAAGADVLDYSLPDEDDAKYRIVGEAHPTGAANQVHAEVLASHLRQAYPTLAATAALSRDTAKSAAADRPLLIRQRAPQEKRADSASP